MFLAAELQTRLKIIMIQIEEYKQYFYNSTN